jgi:hypothetical protein
VEWNSLRVELDHVVVVVETLAGALRDFEDAGFVVTPGGRHDAIPTENALVVFADGTYLELLAARDPDARRALRELRGTDRWGRHLHEASAIARRFLPLLAGPGGVSDFALRTSKLDRIAAETRRRGYALTGPVEMHREQPDGGRLEFNMLFPAEPQLPFLIADRTPIALRVPETPGARAHPNGALGIDVVTVRTPTVVSSAMAYADYFEASIVPRLDGGADMVFAGLKLVLTEGEPAGACGVKLRGASRLTAAVEALGIGAAR